MKTLIHISAVLVFNVLFSSLAAASVIDFDDMSFPGGNPTAASYPPAGYQGFDFGGGKGDFSWVISPNDATGWYGGTKQPYSHSGNNFAWNAGGTDLELTVHGGGTFDLASFWVRSWPAASFNATAHGYLNGSEVFTQAFSTSDTYAQITTNFTHIDRFTFTPEFPRSFLIDDISIDNIVVAVPEPESYMLIVVGLTAMMAASRLTPFPLSKAVS